MIIRLLREDETKILKDFLYEAIFIPEEYNGTVRLNSGF